MEKDCEAYKDGNIYGTIFITPKSGFGTIHKNKEDVIKGLKYQIKELKRKDEVKIFISDMTDLKITHADLNDIQKITDFLT